MSAQLTDRELLEFAAKAAGYPIYSDAWACALSGKTPELFMGHRGPKWNPLTDDGDALRLAVLLRLVIHVWDDYDQVSVAKTLPDGDDPDDASGSWFGEQESSDQDLQAATRIAIVRAAAEIGKAMP